MQNNYQVVSMVENLFCGNMVYISSSILRRTLVTLTIPDAHDGKYSIVK